MDRLTKEQRHRNMQNIRNKDTGIEIRLRKALWHKGYRYRNNDKRLPGKPDICLPKYRIVIFCDSEFFHGKDWGDLKQQLLKGNNSNFWIEKISKNIERDKKVNDELESLGWTVLRFWGKEITKNLDNCIKTIEEAINERSYDV